MSSDRTNDFEYLWDGSEDGWRLLNVSGPDWDSDLPYAIVNVDTRELLSISDPKLQRAVIKKLLNENAPVISEMPAR